ncbi:response regulator [Thiohalobacter thiocyanaticus]|uniref:DNA-binding response regulator n=1 Tax=Thiohalobacter thiocyanaticus TaxID=585455 RepID=A0A426QI60_9GAMM|nr:response regulator transcription factor [Thiohalobacter thiocyanaticus]RRQ21444.1 DNA-binding response regulator [Thiohalobacter thiocyanaticus]
MISVLIADDHPVVRAGMRQIIDADDQTSVIAEAGSGEEVLEATVRSPFDVLLLDISMPGPSGVDLLQRLRAARCQAAILFMSMYPEDQFAVRLLKSGASGYLTKESAPDQLVAAIHKVARGGRFISASLAEILADTLTSDEDRPAHETLSNREYQVFQMLASGKSVSETARELNISVKTVSTYRTRILEKMNMSKNAEFTYYAIKNGLID